MSTSKQAPLPLLYPEIARHMETSAFMRQTLSELLSQQHVDKEKVAELTSSGYSFVLDELKLHDTPIAQYEIEHAFEETIESAPAFSLRHKSAIKVNNSQGYEHNFQESSLRKNASKFPQQEGPHSAFSDNPAPNKYNIEERALQFKDLTISESLPQSSIINNNPAPNYYNPYTSALDHLRQITIRQKHKDVKEELDTPFYLSHSSFKTKAITFPKSPSIQKIAQTPGPGDYDRELESQSSKKYQILEKTYDEARNTNPGPGEYEANTLFGRNTAAIVIKNKYDLKSSADSSVGPGQYDIARENKICGGQFNKSPRNESIKNETPGPGHYDTSQKEPLTAAKIGEKLNEEKGDVNDLLYNPNTCSIQQRNITISERETSKRKTEEPLSPTHYYVNEITKRREIEHETFPKSGKIEHTELRVSPADYYPHEAHTKIPISMKFRAFGNTL